MIAPRICEGYCNCQQSFDTEALLETPGFPDNHALTERCTYNLSTTATTTSNSLLLTFEDLRVCAPIALCTIDYDISFQIPDESSCCSEKALLVIDLANNKTTRICGTNHDPIQVNSTEVILYAKGVDESNQNFGFKVKLEGDLVVELDTL